MRVGAIVQARMGSTRLPGKVLLKAAGKTLLEHLVERLQGASRLGAVIVATSTEPRDEPVAALCSARGYDIFRGNEGDVLDRYYRAACFFHLDVVVRITADCPLIDPEIVDRMIDFFLEHPEQYDLVTNRHPITFPDGLDVDVMPFTSLAVAWEKATTPFQREHTIPYFWEAGMRVLNVEHSDRLVDRHRWTLDYWEDYQLIKAIFEGMYQPGRRFGLCEILMFLEDRPELSMLNSQYLPSKGCAEIVRAP